MDAFRDKIWAQLEDALIEAIVKIALEVIETGVTLAAQKLQEHRTANQQAA